MSDKPQMPENVRDAVLSTRYLLLGFLLSWLPMPATGLAVIPLVASFVYGVRHLRRVKRSEGQSVVPNVVSLVLTGLLIAMVAAPLVQYERTMDYQKCLWGANTRQAKAACESAHDEHPGPWQRFFVDNE